jgi:glycosyltransferase involved in cell wall biosynthesis
MKISYLGNFDDIRQEGLLSILGNLRKYFSRKNTLYTNNPSKIQQSDIINIHSSGFLEAVKYSKLKNRKIYSLYSNLKCAPTRILYDYYQFYGKFYSLNDDKMSFWNRLNKIIMALISQSIPLFVKKYFIGKMDLVVLPSKHMKNKIKLENSLVVKPGIDVEKYIRMKQKSGKVVKLRYFGHPSPGKGVIEVAKAFSKLDGFDKQFFFSFQLKRCANYIRKVDSSAKISGFVHDIVKEYNNSDIVILPYRHSCAAIATPLVLLEAMACERAIITTDLPHIREICGDSVIYVKPYSVEEIVKAIYYLAKRSGLRKELGKKGRQRVVKYYNQEKMFKEYYKLYKKMLKQR